MATANRLLEASGGRHAAENGRRDTGNGMQMSGDERQEAGGGKNNGRRAMIGGNGRRAQREVDSQNAAAATPRGQNVAATRRGTSEISATMAALRGPVRNKALKQNAMPLEKTTLATTGGADNAAGE